MYHELTVWSRGIIMDKEARDVSSCVATAARALGYYADNVSGRPRMGARTASASSNTARTAGSRS